MHESRFFQNRGTFCFDLYWKYHNFERNEICTTVFLKRTNLGIQFSIIIPKLFTQINLHPLFSLLLDYLLHGLLLMDTLWNTLVCVCYAGLNWILDNNIWTWNQQFRLKTHRICLNFDRLVGSIYFLFTFHFWKWFFLVYHFGYIEKVCVV